MIRDGVDLYQSIQESDAVAIDIDTGGSSIRGYCRISRSGFFISPDYHKMEIIGVDML